MERGQGTACQGRAASLRTAAEEHLVPDATRLTISPSLPSPPAPSLSLLPFLPFSHFMLFVLSLSLSLSLSPSL